MITNTPKPSSIAIQNLTKVSHEETWDSNDTTWDTETRTWDEMGITMTGTSKPTGTITNTPKPA